MSSALEPDTATILRHLIWLTISARNVVPDLRVELAWGDPAAGPNRSRTYAIGELSKAASFANWINRKGCNVYVGVTLKAADAPAKGRTAADLAALATCLPVDIDTQFVATAASLSKFAKPQLVVLTGQRPEPRGQLFVRVAPTSDLASWELAHERAVKACGGDANALGRNRLMRLAGSISFPSPKKLARGYAIERTGAHFVPGPEYSIAHLLATLPAPVARPSLPLIVSTPSSQTRRTKPPLAEVEAALRNLPGEYADQQSLWIKVGFALFDFAPDPVGLGLWQGFSQRCPEKCAVTDFQKIWAGFSRPYSGHRITVNWLLREARKPSSGVQRT